MDSMQRCLPMSGYLLHTNRKQIYTWITKIKNEKTIESSKQICKKILAFYGCQP